MNTGAVVPTRLVSVQPPTSSGNAIATATPIAPVGEGARDGTVVDATESNGKSHHAGNNKNNSDVGGSGVDHLASAGPAPSSGLAVGGIPTEPTVSENRHGRSNSEIAAIKRRCAASLLAVIPRNVARTFFGVPPLPSGDGTCSVARAASRNLPYYANVSSTPSSTGGAQPGLSTRTGDLSTSTQTGRVTPPSSERGDIAEQEQTNSEEGNDGVDAEDLFLLETIENDLLDIFADAYCNRHLIYAIIEKVLAKILPEMTERTIADLMADRGVAPVTGVF